MVDKKSARLLLGTLNLLAISTPELSSQLTVQADHPQQIDQLNVASLNSIESSWLRVPRTCKARGFFASPVTLESKAVRSEIQSIYSAFEA